jgi:ACT domain-containing protein
LSQPPEQKEFQRAEALRKPMIEKVIGHYTKGLITSSDLADQLFEIANTIPKRKTATFTVTVDLDPMQGTFHTAVSAQESVQTILSQRISHYNPVVTASEGA